MEPSPTLATSSNINTERKPRVLLGVTGSVATIKLEPLLDELLKFAEVRVVTTSNSLHFFEVEKVRARAEVLSDADEYAVWSKRGDPVLHIQLRDWADILLIAPLSANTLASLANGICNNLLTCVVRAWNFGDLAKQILLAPAMNTQMWENPFTERHLTLLSSPPFNMVIIDSVEKLLMCNVYGKGAMAEVSTIIDAVRGRALSLLRAQPVSQQGPRSLEMPSPSTAPSPAKRPRDVTEAGAGSEDEPPAKKSRSDQADPESKIAQ